MIEDGYAIREPQGFFLIMRNVENGHAGFLMNASNFDLNFIAEFFVER